MKTQTFNPGDLYILRRAMSRMTIHELTPSAPLALLLSAFDLKTDDGYGKFSQLISSDSDLIQAVMKLDPNSPPQKNIDDEGIFIPYLPKEAQLSEEALKASEKVGGWWRTTTAWAQKRSPMTPSHFLEAMSIWCIGVAVARRVYIGLHEDIYPHLYLLMVAETSRYAKSTGMNIFYNLIYKSMPEMLIPGTATTEGMLELLSGALPQNYDKLLPIQQSIIASGKTYAGQRAIIMDEFSGLLASAKKEYMSGFVELLMRLYDAREIEQYYTRSGGMITIQRPGISIMGATTPAAMSRALTAEGWENGEMARYLMFFREDVLPYSNHYEPFQIPEEIVEPLRRLHRRLPHINHDANGEADNPVGATISIEAKQAYDAYAKAVRYDLTDILDLRLHGNYARLHIQALKISLALACIDSVEDTITKRPRIELGHWAIAQQMVERSRTNLHHLLQELSTSRDTRNQNEIISLLKQYPAGLTIRQIGRHTNAPSKAIESALNVLVESGNVIELEHRPSVGRPTKLYRLDTE